MFEINRNFIDGRWVKASTDARLPVIDPTTNDHVGHAPAAEAADVDDAVVSARRAFSAWGATTPRIRRGLMKRLVGLVQKHSDELATLLHKEMGAPLASVMAEQVETPIAIIGDYAAELRKPIVERRIGSSLIVREPIGVVAAILPWNYPLYQLVAKVIPALAAGCTLVVKPSELTPLSTHRFTQLIAESGFPPGVFNVVFGDGPVVGDSMARHPDVDMVSFTGSTRAGRLVSRAAADTVKRVTLELGGKSASLIAPGADVRSAVTHSVQYCMANSGQSCSAWTRLLAPRNQRDLVASLAANAASALEADLGPLISADQYAKVQNYISGAIDEGARLLSGGLGPPRQRKVGNFARATVFDDVIAGMTIATEEVFGPVLSIMYYDSLDEAVDLANQSQYGLHGGVWTDTVKEGLGLARRLRTGQVDINGATFNISAPFGGYKQSGNGRELGPLGLEEFLETKAIQFTEATPP
jgi:acyl-CoA reductase-like NAD-dependent aldehyde dehydrogenase